MRFHLVDRIDEICYGKYITAVKCVSLSDDVFNEHFPGYPVFPGSLIIESLAQLGGAFFELMMKNAGVPVKPAVLSIVNKIKFRRPVVPGDRLVLKAEMLSYREDFGVVEVTAAVDGEECAAGELTFSFLELDNAKLRETRLDLYKICTAKTKIVNSGPQLFQGGPG
ncbi:MAG: 3-hydroxyacyl-[acyl-carrier-protein] dehydratase FabZ [Sporomusaceae bacterium]|nr:3-hydroxyacyl-[acyl-carrier-protein] dehydratase FabZ [Sporomusaceae bacterium]